MSSEQSTIEVSGVSKVFEIYARPEDRLKQMILPRVNTFLGREVRSYHRKFWALRDISLEISGGQTVGILGRNGSGKSTLLQIITGTITPSSGHVTTRGRIAALLELGSGFNPEFTGRENVYMNASLLGMSSEEVDERFDYIAGFADIGDHLDQPVKTYSSGMTLRLAFAVQIAVDADILIIDEALSVGDARFQLKCFRRLEEIKAKGTTILFVSHATELVRSFCDHGLVLEKGETIYWGDAKTATVRYLDKLFPEQQSSSAESSDTSQPAADAPAADPDAVEIPSADCLRVDTRDLGGEQVFGVGGASLEWVNICGLRKPNLLIGGNKTTIQCRFNWQIEFIQSLMVSDGYEQAITLGVAFANNKGTYLFGCNGFDRGLKIDCLRDGTATVEFNLTMPYLAEGDYFLTVAIALGNQDHHVQLRWYDCLLELKSFPTDKIVYGTFAIDYDMKRI